MTAEQTVSNLDEQLWGRIHRVFTEGSPGAEVGPLRPLPGGHSGRTYRLAVDGQELVVKAAPEGRQPIGRHDVLRQSQLLQALEQTNIPVPRVVAADPTGAPWFAMTFVEGEAVEPVLDVPLLEPELARARMQAAVDLMARFHALVPGDLGFTELAYSPGDELDRWSRTLGAVPAELVPHAETLRNRLAAAIPAGHPAGVGARRLPARQPALRRGDPDRSDRLGDLERRRPACGGRLVRVVRRRRQLPRRRHAGGRTSEPRRARGGLFQERTGLTADFPWFRALGSFKMAVIMTHNLVRHREGRHDDPEQELLPDTITHLIRGGFDLLVGGPRPLYLEAVMDFAYSDRTQDLLAPAAHLHA